LGLNIFFNYEKINIYIYRYLTILIGFFLGFHIFFNQKKK